MCVDPGWLLLQMEVECALLDGEQDSEMTQLQKENEILNQLKGRMQSSEMMNHQEKPQVKKLQTFNLLQILIKQGLFSEFMVRNLHCEVLVRVPNNKIANIVLDVMLIMQGWVCEWGWGGRGL